MNHPDLLIDLGNTRLKWALARRGGVLPEPTGAQRHDDKDLPIGQWRQADPARIVIASVIDPEATARLGERLSEQLSIPVLHARTEARWCDLVNGYREPGHLGVDRWLAMIAARQRHPAGPVLVVSAGTALTVDAIAADGSHLGGLIAPGLASLRHALTAVAPRLAIFRDGREDRRLAQGSADAIASGCMQAAVGLVEQIRGSASLPAPVPVLLGGGDANRLAPLLAAPVQLAPGLVLEGLALRHQG